MPHTNQSNPLPNSSHNSDKQVIDTLRPAAEMLHLPLSPKNLSKWVIQTTHSKTISFGKFLGLPFSIDIGGFDMNVMNFMNSHALSVNGLGLGAGLGVSPLPASITVSLSDPHAPGAFSRIILGPAGHQNMGIHLFQGTALAFHLGGGLWQSFGVQILFFLTYLPPRRRTTRVPFAGPTQLDNLIPWDELRSRVKAWTFAMNRSHKLGASVGGDALFYTVHAWPHPNGAQPTH